MRRVDPRKKIGGRDALVQLVALSRHVKVSIKCKKKSTFPKDIQEITVCTNFPKTTDSINQNPWRPGVVGVPRQMPPLDRKSVV